MKTNSQIRAALWSERCGAYRTEARRGRSPKHRDGGDHPMYWDGEAVHADAQRQYHYRNMVRQCATTCTVTTVS